MTASETLPQPVRGSVRGSRRLIWFFVLSTLLVIVWTILLPRIARVPAVKAHLQRLEEHDVNADAMFYTELNHSGRR